MRRLIAFLLLVVVVALSGCANKTKTDKLKPLATALADRLGRTSDNMVVEFQSCGATVCSYDVYFILTDDSDTLNSRFTGVLSTLGDSMSSGAPTRVGHDLVRNLNSSLSTTSVKGRLTATEPNSILSADEWEVRNQKGALTAVVELYDTRDSGVSYAFDNKPLHGHIVHVQSLVDTNQ